MRNHKTYFYNSCYYATFLNLNFPLQIQAISLADEQVHQSYQIPKRFNALLEKAHFGVFRQFWPRK